jgi:hypothetical protein
MAKKIEEKYQLTFKGLLVMILELKEAEKVIDAVELYMRRHDFNSIIFHDGIFSFEKVEKV